MPQFAGQMLPVGSPNATGPLWVPADGKHFHRHHPGDGGTFYARRNWRSGMVGIGRFKLPHSPGWLVLIADYAAGVTLPPDTPTVENPPTQPAGSVTIAAVGAAAPGPVPVSGTVSPASTAVQCAQVIAGNPGAFNAMTVSGTTWSGNVTCSAGSRQIRVRQTNQQFVFTDSNTFTVA